jgi:hypothetical protein
MKQYKIYDPDRDLFYKGGSQWTKDGKVYTNIGHVKLAMTNLGRYTRKLNERLQLFTVEVKVIDSQPLTDILKQ